MSAKLTDERLKEIEAALVECDPEKNCANCDAIRELLAEVRRLRALSELRRGQQGPVCPNLVVEIFKDDHGIWRGDIKPLSETNRGGITSGDTLPVLMDSLTRMIPRVLGSLPRKEQRNDERQTKV